MVAALLLMLVLFEAVAYWHARNVFDDAAAEGVRVAAAFDGSCAQGVAVTRDAITRHGGSWSRNVSISCTDGAMVAITVVGRTPGALAGGLGFTARVTETAPKEA